MVKPLNTHEADMIREIVDLMPMKARRSYQAYLEGDGHRFQNLEDINATHTLTEKGWLKEPMDMLDLNPVHMTAEAWSKYSLDEWAEVQEEAVEKERGDESGSW